MKIALEDKVEDALKYIKNNLSPTELLALCESCYDFKNGLSVHNKSNVFLNTLRLLRMEDDPAALTVATYKAAHEMFGRLVLILLEDDIKRYLDYDLLYSKYDS